MIDINRAHVSRSWPGCGTPLEDACGCPQEPCGHVTVDKALIDCPQHSTTAAKTLRSMHAPSECPGERTPVGMMLA